MTSLRLEWENDTLPANSSKSLLSGKLHLSWRGSGVILNMLNPGFMHSELARDAGLSLAFVKFLLARTTEVGSRTLVAAT